MSSGPEPFVLARRGLPLASPSRRPARSPWFASFAFPRPRASMAYEAPPEEALQGFSLPEDALSIPEEEQQKNGDGPHFPARSAKQRKMGSVPIFPSSVSVFESSRAAVPAKDAPPALPADLVEEKGKEDATPDVGHDQTGQSPAGLHAASAPQRPQDVPRPVSAPASSESVARQHRTQARDVAQSESAPSTSQPARRIPAARAPISPGPISKEEKPALAAPAVVPMGKPPAASKPKQEPHAAVSAAIAQRRRELERVAKAASTPAVTRIGTVEIVVKTPPAPQAVARAPAAPAPAQSEQRKAAPPFRNPWTASRWRRGD